MRRSGKIIATLTSLIAIFLCSSCSETQTNSMIDQIATGQTTNVQTEAITDIVTTTKERVSLESSQEQQYLENDSVDLDLTQMSGTMVYCEVLNMMTAPEEYEGKIIKVSGPFVVYDDPNTGERYFAVLIPDATACCSQGVEFIWAGEHAYPEDYPATDCEITVVGEFHAYEEHGFTYCQLLSAELTVNE